MPLKTGPTAVLNVIAYMPFMLVLNRLAGPEPVTAVNSTFRV